LNLLKVALKRGGTQTSPKDSDTRHTGRVVLELSIQGKTVAHMEMTIRDLGLPSDPAKLENYRNSEPVFNLPGSLLDDLKDAVRQNDQQAPLWLHIESSNDYLIYVPWERLLFPVLKVPILRLPSLSAKPYYPRDPVHIAVCASSPAAKGAIPVEILLEQLANQILRSIRGDVVIHIFADKDCYLRLRDSLPDQIGNWGTRGVRLYDPDGANYDPSPQVSKVSESVEISNPWLKWMADSLAGTPVDGVHFICHGFLSVGQGAIALAQSPKLNEDHQWSRFVGANQLDTLLNRIGAWSLLFSSPIRNFSILGLRSLQQQISHLRTGPNLLHEIDFDRNLKALGKAYSYLYNNIPAPPPASDALSLYAHPPQEQSSAKGLDDDFTKTLDDIYQLRTPRRTAKGIGVTRGSSETERTDESNIWITSSAICLEKTAAELVESASDVESASTSEWQSATDAGVKGALSFVSEVIKRHSISQESDEE
jgi:hypothetical protein